MNAAEFSDIAQGIASIATFLGIIIGGGWALRKYVFQKEDYPRIEFSVDINFVGTHKSQWIIEVLGLLQNKGEVPHKIRDLRFEIRYLSREDKIEAGDDSIGGQLRFRKPVKQGSWTPADSSGPMVILPGISLRYSYVYHVPTTIAFVMLHGKMKYARGGIEDLRADRVVKVPVQGTNDLPND
ncbi:MAG: hypothetical protein PVH61_24055 [Candidatus Aminicenantes bacterium]|jgi:hypothetical protein